MGALSSRLVVHQIKIDVPWRHPEQGADAGGYAQAEMGDVFDLVLVQKDGAHQVDLDLVAGGQRLQCGGVGPDGSLRVHAHRQGAGARAPGRGPK